MLTSAIHRQLWVLFILMNIVLVGCGLVALNPVESNPAATATPTQIGGVLGSPTQTESESPCRGLSGTLEMQILVGPAEAVDLPPVSIGRVPFSVVEEANIFLIEGEGSLDSYEEVLSENWGTYTVSFRGDNTITGVCELAGDHPVLNMEWMMEGEQNVEVISEGFQQEFPWSGTQYLTLSLPAEEGASQQGEGWIVILHLED